MLAETNLTYLEHLAISNKGYFKLKEMLVIIINLIYCNQKNWQIPKRIELCIFNEVNKKKRKVGRSMNN